MPSLTTFLTTFFCSSLFIAFTWVSRVSPPRGCHHTPFYLSDLVSPLFFVNLPTIFSLQVSPPGGCHPGRFAPLAPLVTPLTPMTNTMIFLMTNLPWRTGRWCRFCPSPLNSRPRVLWRWTNVCWSRKRYWSSICRDRTRRQCHHRQPARTVVPAMPLPLIRRQPTPSRTAWMRLSLSSHHTGLRLHLRFFATSSSSSSIYLCESSEPLEQSATASSSSQPSTELKLLRSTDSFRRDLKTFLFHSVYTGTRLRIDSVMRPQSSVEGAIQVRQLQLTASRTSLTS